MVIQHNISALNSHRNLGINNSFTSKNLEKLSSGYKINRAGDDAAGLAISEKMRGQIRGLAMAEQNTSNGISLIQTAEGGLNETHAILQRMRELAVQAANGTYQDEDREQITLEFDALKSEIDRIAESTHYNGIKLLDGSLGGIKKDFTLADATTAFGFLDSGVTVAAGVAKGEGLGLDATGIGTNIPNNVIWGGTISIEMTDNVDFVRTGSTAGPEVDTFTLKITIQDANGTHVLTVGDYINKDVNTPANDGKGTNVNSDGTAGAWAAGKYHVDVSSTAGEVVVTDANGAKFQFKLDAPTNNNLGEGSVRNVAYSYGTDGAVQQAVLNTNDAYVIDGKGQLIFQIGANGGTDQRVGLSVDNMDSKSLKGVVNVEGANKNRLMSLNDASISDRDLANEAIDIITGATNMVSAQRANLGAMQNRLEHTLNNLGVTKENLTAAESSIRDVDMAKEMMEFTKNNILVQASQAMLAQANQLPQGVLQLLG